MTRLHQTRKNPDTGEMYSYILDYAHKPGWGQYPYEVPRLGGSLMTDYYPNVVSIKTQFNKDCDWRFRRRVAKEKRDKEKKDKADK